MFGLIASPRLCCLDLVDCYAFFRSFVRSPDPHQFSRRVIAHTSLSAAQCLLFRRRRRYKIRSSVFGGLPTTTSQNGVASLSAFYLALLSRTHTHSSISVSTNTTNSKSRLRLRYTRRNCVDVASWWYS